MGASSRSTVGSAVDAAPLVRLLFSRAGEPSAGGSMAYNFNHPAGMCPVCTGLGEASVLDEDSLFDPGRSLAEGAILFSQFSAGWQTYLYQNNPLLDASKKLRGIEEEEEAPAPTCPHCKEEIKEGATRCPHCAGAIE